jgi:hypothetical protein
MVIGTKMYIFKIFDWCNDDLSFHIIHYGELINKIPLTITCQLHKSKVSICEWCLQNDKLSFKIVTYKCELP